MILKQGSWTISVMLAVDDTPTAVNWYKRAMGARELWSMGAVACIEIEGAPVFLGQPDNNGWQSPAKLGTTTARVEVFCDNPDAFIARALEAGAKGSLDTLQNHQRSWGTHRQGGFTDPFGHIWLVGDKSPLRPLPNTNRPLPITLLGWFYIAVGAITFAYQFAAWRLLFPLQYSVVLAELLRLAAVVAGIYMLRGRNWARWLALAWIGIHVIISGFHVIPELAMHSLICAIVTYFLFHPTATRYFRCTTTDARTR